MIDIFTMYFNLEGWAEFKMSLVNFKGTKALL